MTFLHIIVPCLTEAFSATSMYHMHRIRHNLHDGHSKHDIYAILIIIYQQLTNIELCLCVWEKRVPVKPKSEIEQFLVGFFLNSRFFIGMSQDLLTISWRIIVWNPSKLKLIFKKLWILVYVRIKVIFYLDHVKKVDFQKRN